VGVLQLMRSSDPWRNPDDVASPYQRLLERHASEIAELMRWALEHEHELTSPVRWHGDSTGGYIVATLGDLGDERDLTTLRSLANDRGLSSAVREAVRQIEARQTVSS
jgi:hypothetical protein